MQAASQEKEPDTGSGRPSTKDNIIQEQVNNAEVKGTEENNVQVKDRRSTRNATAAVKEKAKDNRASSMETVRQKVMSLFRFQCF